jgi:AraC-like DNA-binding protein
MGLGAARSPTAVDLATVTDGHHEDQEDLVVDFVDHVVVACPDPPLTLAAQQLPGPLPRRGWREVDPVAELSDSGRRTISNVTSRPAAEQHLRDLARLRRVRDRMDREYAQPLDVEALARGVHMSAGHLSREFKLAYGESPYGYLMTRRIERAMALLLRGDLSVTEVCFAVGCSSLGTFSTRFTELVGVPPSTYRRQAPRATAGMPPCVAKKVTRPIRNREAPATELQLA